jgi:membrane fusion protein (multidrug efflux system)
MRIDSKVRLLVLVLLIVAPGCDEPQESASPAVNLPVVTVVPVQGSHIVDRIDASGQLLAVSEAMVAAQVGGQVTGVGIEEGGRVTRGQVVIEIDPERRLLELASRKAELAQMRAELDNAEREMERSVRLHSRKAASDSMLDASQTAVKLAQSRLESAKAQHGLAKRALADSSIVAPFDGQIARRRVSVGEYVTPGQQLFELVDAENLEVAFHLAEVDSSRVSKGDPVGVRVAPYPDEIFHAIVTVISPTIDPTTRTLRIKAELAINNGRLRPGLFARVDLGVSERFDVPMVPEEVVLLRSDGSVVYRLVEGNRVERVSVGTGVQREGRVELVGGELAVGDLVVARGQTQLVDGMVVSVRNPDGSVATLSRVGALPVVARISRVDVGSAN